MEKKIKNSSLHFLYKCIKKGNFYFVLLLNTCISCYNRLRDGSVKLQKAEATAAELEEIV